MCTPGIFSSCSMFPITSFTARLVPSANSPTRLEFSSVSVYLRKSSSTSSFSHSRSTIRLSTIVIRSGVSRRSPCLSAIQLPNTPSTTKTPSTRAGAVNVSPPGRLPHFSFCDHARSY